MDGQQPNIHFIEAYTIPECEKKVNDWINNLPYLCQVLGINVLPLILESRLTYVTIVTFLPKPDYIPEHSPHIGG